MRLTASVRNFPLRQLSADLRRAAKRSDIMVVAAAMACYAAFGLVPLLSIATRIASGVYGSGRVHEVAQALSQYVKGPLKLDSGIVEFARTASEAEWWTLVVA